MPQNFKLNPNFKMQGRPILAAQWTSVLFSAVAIWPREASRSADCNGLPGIAREGWDDRTKCNIKSQISIKRPGTFGTCLYIHETFEGGLRMQQALEWRPFLCRQLLMWRCFLSSHPGLQGLKLEITPAFRY